MSEVDSPKPQWWLSFADEDGFRGVCIVRADKFLGAVEEANLLGCNPGGEVRGYEVLETGPVPERYMNRLLSREQCNEFVESKSIREWEEEEF